MFITLSKMYCDNPICHMFSVLECPVLTPPWYGWITEGGEDLGVEATFGCDATYGLMGESVLTCIYVGGNAEWDNEKPTCKGMYAHWDNEIAK